MKDEQARSQFHRDTLKQFRSNRPIQWSEIKYTKKTKVSKILQNNLAVNYKINNFLKLCKNSKKPLILMGYGYRLSDPKIGNIKHFISKNKIPFVCTWNTKDFFPSNK